MLLQWDPEAWGVITTDADPLLEHPAMAILHVFCKSVFRKRNARNFSSNVLFLRTIASLTRAQFEMSPFTAAQAPTATPGQTATAGPS